MQSNNKLSNKLTSYLISAPYSLWMIIFIVVPLAMVAYFALTTKNGEFSLENIMSV